MQTNTHLTMRVKKEDKDKLNELLQKEGMTFSGFVRKMILEHFHISV